MILFHFQKLLVSIYLSYSVSPRNAHSLYIYLCEHHRLCCHTHTHTHTAMPWFAFDLNGFDIWWILNCHRLKKLINAIIFVHMFGVVSDRLKWTEYIPHFTLCSFVFCAVSISYLFGSTFATLSEMVKMSFILILTGYIQLGVIEIIIFVCVWMCKYVCAKIDYIFKSMLSCRDLLHKWSQFPHIFHFPLPFYFHLFGDSLALSLVWTVFFVISHPPPSLWLIEL